MKAKQTYCILLIDDDEDDRHLFEFALQKVRVDSNCLIAADCLQGFEILKSADTMPDIIFLDLNMPVMHGYDGLKLLKSNPLWASIPVIIFSTSGYCSDVERSRALGAAGYLKKPHDFNDLCDKLKEVLAADLKSDFYFPE
jgi:CheY-like chemotaxis protein